MLGNKLKLKNIVVATLVNGCFSHLIHFYMIVELNISKTGISACLGHFPSQFFIVKHDKYKCLVIVLLTKVLSSIMP